MIYCFVFLQNPSEKGSTLKGKNLLQSGSNSFSLEKIPSEEEKSIFTVLPPRRCNNSP